MIYTYNPISQSLEFRTPGDDTPIFTPLLDYTEDMCRTFGVAVGQNGIITSVGPFAATMKTLDRLIHAAVADELDSMLLERCSGDIAELVEDFKVCAYAMKGTLTKIEITAKVNMYKDLAKRVRMQFSTMRK